ncbi:MAG: hypothetical protein QOG64_3052 [Acidimicrobiaceae bacterium]|jgi:hypothetical protein|nr:hypothetical protein [Acidimicrobiaceae bacterium]
MRSARLFPWLLRAAWAALPFTAGPALEAAVHQHSFAVALVAAIALWATWGLVLVATLVPHPVGLTTFRLLAPAVMAATVAAAFDHHPSAPAVGWAAAVAVLAFLPATGLLFVNGPAYPNERRFPLRVPGPLLVGPLPLAWALVVGGPVVGALLLAAHNWVAGGILSVIGVALAILLIRPLHGLSRRWLVMVPAGLVLHDPMTVADPVLFRRQVIETLHAAPAATDSLDLTQRATGLALELELTEKVPMILLKPGDRLGESGSSARLIFTPTRPGAVLADAATRRIPVR